MQYVQRGEWMFVVQYRENTVLFLCKVTERFGANLFKDLWISEKTLKQFGLLSDNSNVKFLWIFCVTPWLQKIFSLIRKIPTEQNLAEPNNSALAILNNSKLQNEKVFNIAKITFHKILGKVIDKHNAKLALCYQMKKFLIWYNLER